MKTYGFKKQFAAALESDAKLSTIRALSVHRPPPVPGEIVRRYTGMRTKQCTHHGDRICSHVKRLRIDRRASFFVNGRRLNSLDLVTISAIDGFDSVQSLKDFFRANHGLPFKGHLIVWHPKAAVPAVMIPHSLTNPKLRNV